MKDSSNIFLPTLSNVILAYLPNESSLIEKYALPSPVFSISKSKISKRLLSIILTIIWSSTLIAPALSINSWPILYVPLSSAICDDSKLNDGRGVTRFLLNLPAILHPAYDPKC